MERPKPTISLIQDICVSPSYVILLSEICQSTQRINVMLKIKPNKFTTLPFVMFAKNAQLYRGKQKPLW